VTDDRQTDHATEICVGIGVIACAARANPRKNNSCVQVSSDEADANAMIGV